MITVQTKHSAIIFGMALFLAACGEDGVVETTSVQDLEPAAAIPETVDTASLVVDENFSFDTARMIDVNFDITEAKTEEASVSICTEYYTSDGNFDINYDSCPVKGRLENGLFDHTMEVTNAYDSVVAVIWFQNQDILPVFQEFKVDTQTRTKQDRQVIVWHR